MDAAPSRSLTIAEIVHEVLDEERGPLALEELVRRVGFVRPADPRAYRRAIRRAIARRGGVWEVAPGRWALAKWFVQGSRLRTTLSEADAAAGVLRLSAESHLPFLEPALAPGRGALPLVIHYEDGAEPLRVRRVPGQAAAWTGLGPAYAALGLRGGEDLFLEVRDYERMVFILGVLPRRRAFEASRLLANRMLAGAAERVLRDGRFAQGTEGWVRADELVRRIWASERLPGDLPADPLLSALAPDARFVVGGAFVRRLRPGEAAVGAAIARFTELLRDRVQPKACEEAGAVLGLLREYLVGYTSVERVEEVTSVEIGDFFTNYYLARVQGLTPQRVQDAMVCVKRFCYWAAETYEVSADFHFNWVYGRLKQELPRVVSIREAFERAGAARGEEVGETRDGYWEVLRKRRTSILLKRFDDREELTAVRFPSAVHSLIRKGDVLGLELGLEGDVWRVLRVAAALPSFG